MNNNVFELAPEIERDSLWLADWPLCQLRVQNDANYPWFILVPRRVAMVEIIDLTQDEQGQLWRESAFLSEFTSVPSLRCRVNRGLWPRVWRPRY